MTNSVPSTNKAPRALLSTSYIAFRERVADKGFHFKIQLFNGNWSSVPRSSYEHKRRLASLDEAISDLVTKGK